MNYEKILAIITEIEAISDKAVLEKTSELRALIDAPSKSKMKVQHAFNKKLAEIPFFIDYQGVKATVFWQKRNELRILKGANLKQEFILTAKGEKTFSDKFGETLRNENRESIEDFVLIKDVVLKSVNEVGTFLYFGGTNSWQILMNQNGETLDELTKK